MAYTTNTSGHRSGFTLIELLVTISIIGILVALILPAVQAARESARRINCGNNLKQIGLGFHSYHSVYGSLPIGRLVSNDSAYSTPGISCSGPLDRSYLVALLPFHEQSALYNGLNNQTSILGFANSTCISVVIAGFACPSDTYSGILRKGSINEPFPNPIPDLDHVSSTSYTGIMGTVYAFALPNPNSLCSIDPMAVVATNGCINDLPNLSFASIIDGLSNTMIVAERATSILQKLNDPVDPLAEQHSGWWFQGEVGYTIILAGNPPNYYLNTSPSKATISTVWTNSASSLHPGGVNVLMADGSSKFIKNSIQSSVSQPIGIWQKMATRNGGEVIADY